MLTHHEPPRRLAPMALGGIALISLAVLMAWDAVPSLFHPRAHDLLGAFPLALIAFGYLAHQAVLRPGRKDLVKAILLAVAFLFWAANQLWPDLPQATPFNDLAIALFVLDVFLTMIGWPAASAEGRRRTLTRRYFPASRQARSPTMWMRCAATDDSLLCLGSCQVLRPREGVAIHPPIAGTGK